MIEFSCFIDFIGRTVNSDSMSHHFVLEYNDFSKKEGKHLLNTKYIIIIHMGLNKIKKN